jgi:hypothetical protein
VGATVVRGVRHDASTERNRWLLVIQPVKPFFDVNVTYIHATCTLTSCLTSSHDSIVRCAASIFTCYQYANLLNLNLIYMRFEHGDPEWERATCFAALMAKLGPVSTSEV